MDSLGIGILCWKHHRQKYIERDQGGFRKLMLYHCFWELSVEGFRRETSDLKRRRNKRPENLEKWEEIGLPASVLYHASVLNKKTHLGIPPYKVLEQLTTTVFLDSPGLTRVQTVFLDLTDRIWGVPLSVFQWVRLAKAFFIYPFLIHARSVSCRCQRAYRKNNTIFSPGWHMQSPPSIWLNEHLGPLEHAQGVFFLFFNAVSVAWISLGYASTFFIKSTLVPVCVYTNWRHYSFHTRSPDGNENPNYNVQKEKHSKTGLLTSMLPRRKELSDELEV